MLAKTRPSRKAARDAGEDEQAGPHDRAQAGGDGVEQPKAAPELRRGRESTHVQRSRE